MPDNKFPMTQSGFINAPNQQQLPLQNNNMGMQTRPQLGPGIQQNLKPCMTNMKPAINPPAFMHAANNILPLKNNQLVPPQMNLAGPTTQQGQFHVGFGPWNGVGNVNCSQMSPVQGQNMMSSAQINFSQSQGHILAQHILSMLQQNNMNMNMPNGQFCAPFPLQNMNQQLPLQVSNPSQVVPCGPPGSHPMLGFPNQFPQTMVPQNPFFPSNTPLGHVPGNLVRPPVNKSENMFPPVNTNMFMSSPFASQQLEGNTLAPCNPNPMQLNHAKHSQPAFTNSQANPNNNDKANGPNSKWKGSAIKNFKNKTNQGRFQGGFQKDRFHDISKGKRKFGGSTEHRHKGFNDKRAENSGVNTKEQNHEVKRSLSMTYTEQEIQQWREARRKNYPSKYNFEKKQCGHLNDSKVVNREVLRRELKEILAKQAALGVEVAEIPSHYLRDSTNKCLKGEEKRKFSNKRKFQNTFDRRTDRQDQYPNKQKVARKDFPKSPTLLQKLLSADIRRDQSHLFQVFRFMVMNSFFKDWPDKPLRYPSVMVKENGLGGGDKEKSLHPGNDVPECVNDNNGDDGKDGDEDDYENDSIEQVNPREEDCDEGTEQSDEEEGEIID